MTSKLTDSSHSIHLWFSKVGDATIKLEKSTEHLLSSSEKERLQSTQSTNKKREFLTSRALMRHALSQQLQLPENEWQFIEHPNSSPTISNLPKGIYFSLSHSKGLICFALSNSPIGIDVEVMGKKRDFLALARSFMNDDEVDILVHNEDKQADNFYRIWCAKEAHYKATPLSEQSTISISEISFPSLIKSNGEWFLFEGIIDQCRLAVVAKNKPKAIDYNYFPPTAYTSITELSLTREKYT